MNISEIKQSIPNEALLTIDNLSLPKAGSGKVREIYDLGDKLLIIATDRISAFDVIMPNGVPGKGILLTQLSLYWFERTRGIADNHLVPNHDEALKSLLANDPHLVPRSMLVRKLEPLTIEAVVRGYLSGSGWKDYTSTGKLFGQDVPSGLVESDRLPQPMFTPTTKASEGHDLPLSLKETEDILGSETYRRVVDTSMDLFALGQKLADAVGLILADTKFEFGRDDKGEIVLIDEVLTPDSSRYWPKDDYSPGRGQHAFDKQFVRDYLETLDWNKTPPAPTLPEEVVKQSFDRYLGALERLMEV
jgi:phosphoribosylaminoimidazole-succinocarboxamide synthase